MTIVFFDEEGGAVNGTEKQSDNRLPTTGAGGGAGAPDDELSLASALSEH